VRTSTHPRARRRQLDRQGSSEISSRTPSRGCCTRSTRTANYLNREAFTEMRDEQRGMFYGLGIQINKRGPDQPLTIIARSTARRRRRPAFSPATHLENRGSDTIGLTVQDAVRKLKARGHQGHDHGPARRRERQLRRHAREGRDSDSQHRARVHRSARVGIVRISSLHQHDDERAR